MAPAHLQIQGVVPFVNEKDLVGAIFQTCWVEGRVGYWGREQRIVERWDACVKRGAEENEGNGVRTSQRDCLVQPPSPPPRAAGRILWGRGKLGRDYEAGNGIRIAAT